MSRRALRGWGDRPGRRAAERVVAGRPSGPSGPLRVRPHGSWLGDVRRFPRGSCSAGSSRFLAVRVVPTRRGQVTVSRGNVKDDRLAPECHCEIGGMSRVAKAWGESLGGPMGRQEATVRRLVGAGWPAKATATAYLRAA